MVAGGATLVSRDGPVGSPIEPRRDLGHIRPGDASHAEAAALETRIIDAAVRLFARWGVRKTTIADVAREAGCSRATVYRAFPGGKHQLFLAVGAAELNRFLTLVAERTDEASTPEDALVAALTTASSHLADHRALQFLLRHEPGVVLPYLSFHNHDRLLAMADALVSPHLTRQLGERASLAVELGARLVLSYLFNPSPAVDLRSETDARRVVRQFLMPALGG